MPITEAIILAGGLGTRLREAVPGLPKCMAPILAKPFIGYLMDYFHMQGIEKFILCLGYKYEVIEQYLNTQYANLNIKYSVEQEPLGTGGAIRLACTHATENTVLILNGDTFFKLDVAKLSAFHDRCGAACTMALKPMVEFDRYGVVQLDKNHAVNSFKEKQYYATGLVNGGAYALQVNQFLNQDWPSTFSFETQYLEQPGKQKRIYGFIQDEYFIDIGIPADFERAQMEIPGIRF